MIIRFLFTSLFIFLFIAGPVSAANLQPWSENVFVEIKKEHGPDSEKRMRKLHDIILKNQDKSIEEKLRLVNDTMNNLPWIADEQHWKKADYWASPIETIASFGGDCEDIAIAKWIVLRTLGIPRENLRLVFANIKQKGEYHMVLAYVGRIDIPREERLKSTWILDNVNKKVMRADERKDLLYIYAIDRKIGAVRENTNMKKLEEIKQKIQENMAKFKEINEGRSLFPE